MRIITTLIISTLSLSNAKAQNYPVSWAHGFGEFNSDQTLSVTTDENNNVYAVGLFSGTVDFDPGVGIDTITSQGEDGCIVKYDANGNYLWAIKVGGSGDDRVNNITFDGTDIIVIGDFQSTVDFNPGIGVDTLTAQGNDDMFLAKYTVGGSHLYSAGIGGTGGNCYGLSAASDASNNVIVTGYFFNSADFDPGPGTLTLNSTGSGDVFFAKYNSSLVLDWAHSLEGTNGWETGSDVVVDSNGDIIITGVLGDSVDLDPSAGETKVYSPNGGMLLAKYSSTGSYLWGMYADGTNYSEGLALALDPSNNVYVTGYLSGTTNFKDETGTLLSSYTSVGGTDVFLLKFSSSGALIFDESFGGPDWDFGSSIQVQADESFFVGGYFGSTVDFDLSMAVDTLTSLGNADGYIASYNATGGLLWTKQIGGTAYEEVSDLALDSLGNILAVGGFYNTVDFDESSSTLNLTSNGLNDAFTVKYTNPFIGIEDLSDQPIFVYPNPSATGIFFVQGFVSSTANVHDAMGKQVSRVVIDESGMLDLSNLSSGMYFLHVQGQYQKLIIK